MQISLIPYEHLDEVWPKIEEYMEGAAEYTFGRFIAEDILDGLKTKPQQLWIAYNETEILGGVVTEIMVYPRMNTLTMHFTGGKELPKWKDPMLSALQLFAQANDCSVIESFGREGWGRVFKNDGYKSRFTVYELPVEKIA
jgi:hypothetical protein